MVAFILETSLSTQSIKTIERVVTASIPARVMEVSQIIVNRHIQKDMCRLTSIWRKAQTFDGYSKIDQGSLLACTTRMFEIHLDDFKPKLEAHRDLSKPSRYTRTFELTPSRHPTIHFSKNKTVSSLSVVGNFRHPRRVLPVLGRRIVSFVSALSTGRLRIFQFSQTHRTIAATFDAETIYRLTQPINFHPASGQTWR